MSKIEDAFDLHKKIINELDMRSLHICNYSHKQKLAYHKNNELRCLSSGTYELPDFISDYLTPDQILHDIPHLPRLNNNIGINMIVKLKRLDNFRNEKHSPIYDAIKIGKYIKSLNPDLSDTIINELTSRLKNHRLQNAVKTTNDTRLIKAVYVHAENGINTAACMTGKNKHNWHFAYPKHPALVYGGKSEIKLAYIRHNKKVAARCLYSDRNRRYSVIYGGNPHSNNLAHHFESLGYSQSDDVLDGHTLNQVFCDDSNHLSGGVIVPYIDGHHRVNLSDDGIVTIDYDGTHLATAYTTCTSTNLVEIPSCSHCNVSIIDSDDGECITAEDDAIFCDYDCVQSAGYRIDIDGYYRHDSNLYYSERHSEYILFSRLNDYCIYEAVDNVFYHADELIEINNTYYPINDSDLLIEHGVMSCEHCHDYYLSSDKTVTVLNKSLIEELKYKFCSFACLVMEVE